MNRRSNADIIIDLCQRQVTREGYDSNMTQYKHYIADPLCAEAAERIEELSHYKTEYEALLIQHQDLLRRSQNQ